MILVIVFVMSIPKRAWAPQVQTIVARFAPLGIGPFNYVQVMMFNDFCKVAAPSVLRVFDVFDGSEIGITPLGIIEPGEGAIRTFFRFSHTT